MKKTFLICALSIFCLLVVPLHVQAATTYPTTPLLDDQQDDDDFPDLLDIATLPGYSKMTSMVGNPVNPYYLTAANLLNNLAHSGNTYTFKAGDWIYEEKTETVLYGNLRIPAASRFFLLGTDTMPAASFKMLVNGDFQVDGMLGISGGDGQNDNQSVFGPGQHGIVAHNVVNNGYMEVHGGNGGVEYLVPYPGNAPGGIGMVVNNILTNKGWISVEGGEGGVFGQTIAYDNTSMGGNGIEAAGVINQGTIVASGGDGGGNNSGGAGLLTGSLENAAGAYIIAQGGNAAPLDGITGGMGVGADFINNYGVVLASGGSGGQGGLAVGGNGGPGMLLTSQNNSLNINHSVMMGTGGTGGDARGGVQQTPGQGGQGIAFNGALENSGMMMAFGGTGGNSLDGNTPQAGGTGGSGISAAALVNNGGANFIAVGGQGGNTYTPGTANFVYTYGGAGMRVDGDFTNYSAWADPGRYSGSLNVASTLNEISTLLALNPAFTFLNINLNQGLPGVIATGGSNDANDDDPSALVNTWVRGGAGIEQVSGVFNNQGVILAQGGAAGSGQYSHGGHGYHYAVAGGTIVNQGTIFALKGEEDEDSASSTSEPGSGFMAGAYIDQNGNQISGSHFVNQGILYANGDDDTQARQYGAQMETLDNQTGALLALDGRMALLASNSQGAATAVTLYENSFFTVFEDGQLNVARGNVEIMQNAIFRPIMAAPEIQRGQSTEWRDFIRIEQQLGQINGQFSFGPEVTWRFATQKGSDTDNYMQYRATRLYFPSDLINETNSRNLATFTQYLAADNALMERLTRNLDINGLLAYIVYSGMFLQLDNAWDVADLNAKADSMARTSTPQATTQLYNQALRQQRALGEIFAGQMQHSNQLKQLAAMPAYQLAAGEGGLTAPGSDSYDYVTWLRPFYHTGRQDATTPAFSDLNQNFGGLSFGGAANLGAATLGLGLHYIHGEMDGNGYNADADSFGFMLGLGRHFRVNDTFNPWAQIHAGYTYQNIDQSRRDYIGNLNTSSPDNSIFTVGGLLSNEFNSACSVSITPRLGLDYTHMKMDGYSESGGYLGFNSPLALDVDTDNYASLVANLGLSADWRINQGIALQGRAYYYYEFMDTQCQFSSRAPALPGYMFVTQGQDLNRHAGQLGLGLNLSPTDNFTFGMNYDLWLADNYVGHQIDVSFKLMF